MPYLGNELATQFQAFVTQTITGDGSTGYTLDRAVANGKELLVYINNVKQEEGSGKSYTASGTTITFSAAVASTDSCYVVFLGSAVQTVNPPDNSVGITQLAVSDGSNGQFLSTNGSGTLSFATVSTGVALDDITTGDAAATLATSSGDITLDTTADIILDADGGDVHFQDNGSSNRFISIKNSSGSCVMSNPTADGDITFQGNDDGVGAVNALVLDMSAGGAATFNKGVTLSDGDISLASGHGISFAATSDASGMAAELLDDYEEGTFTPAGNGVTFQVGSGVYTKVGRIVHVSLIVTNASTSSGTTFEITGFPFTCQNGNQFRGVLPIGFTDLDDASVTAFIMSANTTSAVMHRDDGSSRTYGDASGKVFIMSGSYPTAS